MAVPKPMTTREVADELGQTITRWLEIPSFQPGESVTPAYLQLVMANMMTELGSLQGRLTAQADFEELNNAPSELAGVPKPTRPEPLL